MLTPFKLLEGSLQNILIRYLTACPAEVSLGSGGNGCDFVSHTNRNSFSLSRTYQAELPLCFFSGCGLVTSHTQWKLFLLSRTNGTFTDNVVFKEIFHKDMLIW